MTKRQYAKRNRENEREREEREEEAWIGIGIAIKKEMLEIPMRSPTRIDFVSVAPTAIALRPPPLGTLPLEFRVIKKHSKTINGIYEYVCVAYMP